MEKFSADRRYITRGIKDKINSVNPTTYLFLWDLIDEMDVEERDYLQVFILRTINTRGKFQEIEHLQEKPPYKRLHWFKTECPVDTKVFVIDDGENSVMMLAEEY